MGPGLDSPCDSVSTLKEISRIPGNLDSFQVISGKWKNSRKFQEIQDFEKSTKTCGKYDFYGMKKRKCLARLLRSLTFKPVSLWLLEGSTPKLWIIFSKKGIYVNYVVQIVSFCGHLTSKLWPSSVSGNWDKFREISEFIRGNFIFELWKHCPVIREVPLVTMLTRVV